MTDDEVMLRVQASPMRRTIGVGSLMGMGLLMLWIAFAGTAPFHWLAILLVGATVSLWGGLRLWAATTLVLELTEKGIRTSEGTVLVAVEDVERIDRSAFAFKPSNGFLVRLKTPAERRWIPGVWWRYGTFLGIGGVLPPGETRAMADLLKGLVSGDLPLRP